MELVGVDTFAEGECHIRLARRSFFLQSASGAVMDVVLATMPVLILRDVKVANCQRNAILAVVVLAELAGIAMLARMSTSREWQVNRDWTWASLDIAVWSMVEPAIGILALCLATFAPVMSYLWPTSTKRLPIPGSRRTRHSSAIPFYPYRRDFASESGFRGIPLESGYGNRTHVETGLGQSDTTRPKEAHSNESIEGAGQKWDTGIVKTTELITSTHIEERVSTQIARPQSILKP